MTQLVKSKLERILNSSAITAEVITKDLKELDDPIDRVRYLNGVKGFVSIGIANQEIFKIEPNIDSLINKLEEKAVNNVKRFLAAPRDFERDSEIDALTGAYNYGNIERRMEQPKEKYSILMLDMDSFKEINDAFGHAVGDYVLKNLFRVILETTRESYIARYGGDEFYIELNHIDKHSAKTVAERIANAVENKILPYVLSDLESFGITIPNQLKQKKITVSIGVADEKQGKDPHEVLRNADGALYLAKMYGKNRVVMFGENPYQDLTARQRLLYNLSEQVGKLGSSIRHFSEIIKSRF